LKQTVIFLSLALFCSILSGQTTLVTEGTVTNSLVTGDWGGVNIPRSVPTAFTFRNNSITSLNVSGYMLQAGDEVAASTNDNLDGEIITGNRFTWNGSDMTSIAHGVFTGHNKNVIIEYNYLDKVPMGIVRKSANDMSNSSGGVAYNLIISPSVGVVVKGMSNVNIYNNTFYQTRTYAQTNRGLIDVYTNTDVSPSSYAHGTKIKNNIFYTKYQTTNIRIIDNDCLTGFECDYNLYWCEAGTPTFDVNGAIITFTQWQALGYDTHSVVVNPNFISFTDLNPAARLDYGTKLGASWQTGLSATATWITGSYPSTTDQDGTWQVGARISNTIAQIPVYIGSVIDNATPAMLVMNFSLNLANIIPAASAFTVGVNSENRAVISVAVSGTKVQLTLANSIKLGEIVTVSYTKPGNNPLQTSSGGMAASIAVQPVTNNIIKTTDPLPLTITLTVSSNHIHKILSIQLGYSSTPTSSLSPEVIRVLDISGNLYFEKLLVVGVSNISIPVNLSAGIYNVQIMAAGVEMDSKKVIVY
jgi:uncharacterized repeat protein (TIGR02059 family)